jgi:hypothetical protein
LFTDWLLHRAPKEQIYLPCPFPHQPFASGHIALGPGAHSIQPVLAERQDWHTASRATLSKIQSLVPQLGCGYGAFQRRGQGKQVTLLLLRASVSISAFDKGDARPWNQGDDLDMDLPVLRELKRLLSGHPPPVRLKTHEDRLQPVLCITHSVLGQCLAFSVKLVEPVPVPASICWVLTLVTLGPLHILTPFGMLLPGSPFHLVLSPKKTNNWTKDLEWQTWSSNPGSFEGLLTTVSYHVR